MDFRVLGPIEVVDRGRVVALGRPKQRALLALMLMHPNEVLSVDRILDELWAEEPPAGGSKTLQVHVARLRKALEPDRSPGAESELLVTRTPGYVLEVEPNHLDATQFELLVAEAGDASTADPEASLALLKQAFDLWRGRPYEDVAYEAFAQNEIRRLEELRLTALERRIDAELRLGGHETVIGELQTLIEQEPFRERLWAHLVVALYRSGRQAEAVRAGARAREMLAELGLEPSSQLRSLENRILQQDPSLLDASAGAAPSRVRGYEIRGPIGEGAFGVTYRAYQPSVQREVAIKAIHSDVANRPEFVRRFESEARLVAQLEHPHIVPLYDFWREPTGAYLVMPFLRGGNLTGRLREGPLPAREALRIVEQVGAGLAFAHRRGVVHRDLHPGNVLLGEEGDAYLADFGIAAARDEDAPPEGVTVRADVHGLGLLTLSMVSGELASGGTSDTMPAGLDPRLADTIATAIAPDPADRYASVDEFLAALRTAIVPDSAAAPVRASVRNPYKGLRAFTEADAGDFFGRQGVVNELLDATSRRGLVAVIGPSGSGKSSVVRAGLVPAIRGGRLEGDWLVADLYPGARPFAELSSALLGVAVEPIDDLERRLRQDPALAAETVQRLLPPRTRLLLLIDQFEELFTLTVDETVRRAVMDALASMAGDRAGRIKVALTLRADYLDRPLAYSEFGPLLKAGSVMITPPNATELADAVVAPARGVGVELEAGLEADFVGDVVDQPGTLPLMEFTLTELFDRRSDHVLTRASYSDGGGVLGALGRRAEDLYATLDSTERTAIRQLSLRLVAVGEDGAATRRRVRRDELAGLPIESKVLDHVLSVYGSARLLTFDRDPESRTPTVELAHEALLDRWDRLRTWVDDHRDDLVDGRRLHEAHGEWLDQARSDAYLLVGGRLGHFEEWALGTDLSLTTDEGEFLDASRRRAKAAAARRRRRRRLTMAGFAAAAVIAAVLAVAAWVSQQRAEESAAEALQQAQIAAEHEMEAEAQTQLAKGRADTLDRERGLSRSRDLAAASVVALGVDPELSMLLALEAVDAAKEVEEPVTREAEEALHRAVMAAKPYRTLPWAMHVAALPDGDFVLAGETVTRFDGTTLQPVVTYEDEYFDLYGVGPMVAASPDGNWIVATLGPATEQRGLARVFDATSGELVAGFAGTNDGAAALAFSADGQNVAKGHDDGTILVHNLEDQIARRELPEGSSPGLVSRSREVGRPVRDVDFSPDGSRLVAAGIGAGTVNPVILDAATGEWLMELEGHEWTNLTARYLPDGERIVTTSFDQTIRMWDASDGTLLTTQHAEGVDMHSLAVSPDGRRLAVGGSAGDLTIWRVDHDGLRLIDRLGGHTELVSSLAFSPNGTQLVSVTSPEGTEPTRVWDLAPDAGGEWGIVEPKSSGAVAFSPDGSTLASGLDFDRHIALWDTATWEQGLVYEDTAEFVDEIGYWGFTEGAVFSSDGTRLATASWSGGDGPGSVKLWDVTTGGLLHTLLEGIEARGIVFSDDGALVAAATCARQDHTPTARVWDATTGELVFEASGRRGSFCGFKVDFSPDGRFLAVQVSGLQENLHLWDLETGEADVLGTHSAGFQGAVEYSPDGSRIVTAGRDGTAKVWNAAGRTLEATLEAHLGPVEEAIWTPDGERIVTAGDDGMIRFWDAETGREYLTLDQGAEIAHLAISPDGSMLAAAYRVGIHVWALDLDDLEQIARARLHRDFTEAELCTYHFDGCELSE